MAWDDCRIRNLESTLKRYRSALENIKKHYEFLEPKTYRQLTAWNIADKALDEGEWDD